MFSILLGIGLLLSVVCVGYMLNLLMNYLPQQIQMGEPLTMFVPSLLFSPWTWILGTGFTLLAVLFWFLMKGSNYKSTRKYMKGDSHDIVEGSLENSRFMTDAEKQKFFPGKTYKELGKVKKDGVPVYAVYNNKKKDMDLNLISGVHSIIIGATGSGKTTTFMNPAIQIIGSCAAGSSMIMTDPKGELFQMHSRYLVERGYKVMVLDLRDPYSSYRWNPLGDIYDRYQLHLHAGDGIFRCTNDPQESGLKLMNSPEEYGEEWYEFDGKAWAVRKELIGEIRVRKQKIYDELYEDLNDLVSCLCPIESKDDPVWEKGARSIIMACALGMLEDSENPELGMTREKFNLYNVNKAIQNSQDGYKVLKEYFQGRPKLSRAASNSRQVMSAPDDTLNSYMSIALDKMSLFNDEGLCSLTSETDINPTEIATQPVALFLKIPDEKDTRHGLAALFILCIYKALIKFASSREDLSLPRNVYFLLDEFGNMPKIEKFDKMITVGRSRKIWFHMIVQSFAQLENVYGKTVADIVKGNCGLKMFIGSNDIGTCEEFSKLCGNYTVSTASVSTSTSGVSKGEMNVSSQLQQRPLIYPAELQRLNNKQDTGHAICVTFGNFPLKTRYTPSYKNPLYKFGQMDLTEVRNHAFYSEEVYYDLEERNYAVLEAANSEASEELDNSGAAADAGESYEGYDDSSSYDDERYGDDDDYEEDGGFADGDDVLMGASQ